MKKIISKKEFKKLDRKTKRRYRYSKFQKNYILITGSSSQGKFSELYL